MRFFVYEQDWNFEANGEEFVGQLDVIIESKKTKNGLGPVYAEATFWVALYLDPEEGLRFKHSADTPVEKWSCEGYELQVCNSLKDEIEKYLASRILLFHHEEHCNHLDHFEQVIAFKLLSGAVKHVSKLGQGRL